MATTEPAPDLTYRPMAHVDLDAVVRMYDDAGWGPMPRETLQQWFFSGGAHGGPLVMAAVQPDGSVVGMIVLYPREVQLFERVGVACRMAGAVLAPHVRWSARADAADTSTADDFTGPLIDMLRASDEHVEARGWELMFALPHPRLAGRVTRALEGNVPMTAKLTQCSFPGVRIDFADAPAGDIPLEVGERAAPFPPEYDTLWERARVNLGIECAAMRSAEALTLFRGRDLTLECRDPRRGDLVGYASFASEENSKLMDVLAVDRETFEPVVKSATNWLRARVMETGIRSASAFAHPRYRDALVAAGAVEIDWPFSFLVRSRAAQDRAELDADRWYVTTGD